MTSSPSPAAWYPDPHEEGDLRWWDGRRWTDHIFEITTADEIPANDSALDGNAEIDWYVYRSANDPHGTPVMIRMQRRTMFEQSWLEFTRSDGVVLGSIGIESGLIETESRSMRIHLRWGLAQWCSRHRIAMPTGGDCRDLARNRPAHGLLETVAKGAEVWA